MQRSPWQRLINRGALGLAAAVAAMALVAPVAGASPESDASDAIDTAWTAAGGDTSPLGSKEGGVYPAADGFGQNFVGGAIFYTPDTGARIMYGAILDRYRSLGAADSDLGFPNIDEGPGRISRDSRNSTFSAADHPVIFWTPGSGAWVVRGAVNAAWDRLGGSAGVLGVPVADETYDGEVVSQKFSEGQISFDGHTKVFTTEPSDLAAQLGDLTIPGDAASAIGYAYRAAGGGSGPLGARQGDQFPVPPDGAGQAYTGGKVFYSPGTGAHAVTGAILEKYEAAGGATGDLGLPDAAEADGGVAGSRVTSFAAPDTPVIFWAPDRGAVIVRGAMRAAWDKLGGAVGALGVPLSDQSADGSEVTQRFSGGQVNWNAATNTFATDPKNLAEALTGVEVPAQLPAAPAAPASKKDTGFVWHAWWLWWIIPLVLLVLAMFFAWLSGRRHRAAAARRFGDVDREIVAPSRPVTDEGPRWSPPAEEAYAPGRREGEEPVDTDSRWAATQGTETDSDIELFTHRGAHASDDDPDSVDTAPTPVPSGADERHGRHAAAAEWTIQEDDPQLPASGSLFAPAYGAVPPSVQPEPDVPDVIAADVVEHRAEEHVAEEYGEPVIPVDETEIDEQRDVRGVVRPTIHLPLDNPDEAPDGYPIKGSMATGSFYIPGGPGYDETVADIWFADADHAEANGFTPVQ
jgi:uncharacterized protein with LGFP repeats